MRRIDSQKVSNYFEHGFDADHRRIFLSGDIEENNTDKAVQGLYLLDSISQDKVSLFINSFGGCDYEMFRVYDTIMTIKCPIETVAMGKCMSAAPLIVAAGSHGIRFATENTVFMIHDYWFDIPATRRSHDASKELDHAKAQTERWASLMTKHTLKNNTFWLSLCRRGYDTYITAEEALKYGIIDTIWQERSTIKK